MSVCKRSEVEQPELLKPEDVFFFFTSKCVKYCKTLTNAKEKITQSHVSHEFLTLLVHIFLHHYHPHHHPRPWISVVKAVFIEPAPHRSQPDHFVGFQLSRTQTDGSIAWLSSTHSRVPLRNAQLLVAKLS